MLLGVESEPVAFFFLLGTYTFICAISL